MFKDLRFRAISSPPYENVPAFQWSKFDYNTRVRHVGQPDFWKFGPVEPVWETFDVKADI
uniref:Phospholipase B-like n=1 Tax=Syphacia muris TaxID=451379 RepID=A0A0N5AVC0_9BILA